MGKLYTLDGKLLTETPEIRIGEKVYPVDSRQKTVKKILALADDESKPMGERIDEALKLALGDENAVEIDRMDMPFPAYPKADDFNANDAIATLVKGKVYDLKQTRNGWAFLLTDEGSGGWACIEDSNGKYLDIKEV